MGHKRSKPWIEDEDNRDYMLIIRTEALNDYIAFRKRYNPSFSQADVARLMHIHEATLSQYLKPATYDLKPGNTPLANLLHYGGWDFQSVIKIVPCDLWTPNNKKRVVEPERYGVNQFTKRRLLED